MMKVVDLILAACVGFCSILPAIERLIIRCVLYVIEVIIQNDDTSEV